MNYVFPELATYKREWVPLLEAAKEWVKDYKVVYVCNALDFVAREYEDQGAEEAIKAAEAAKEIEDLIASAIKGYETVTEWYHTCQHRLTRPEQRVYRLAWIDHMIKECER